MTVTGKITLPLAPQKFSAKADANGAFAFPLTISETGRLHHHRDRVGVWRHRQLEHHGAGCGVQSGANLASSGSLPPHHRRTGQHRC